MEPIFKTHFAESGIIYVKLYLPFLPPSQLSVAGVIMGHVLFLPTILGQWGKSETLIFNKCLCL